MTLEKQVTAFKPNWESPVQWLAEYPVYHTI